MRKKITYISIVPFQTVLFNIIVLSQLKYKIKYLKESFCKLFKLLRNFV